MQMLNRHIGKMSQNEKIYTFCNVNDGSTTYTCADIIHQISASTQLRVDSAATQVEELVRPTVCKDQIFKQHTQPPIM